MPVLLSTVFFVVVPLGWWNQTLCPWWKRGSNWMDEYTRTSKYRKLKYRIEGNRDTYLILIGSNIFSVITTGAMEYHQRQRKSLLIIRISKSSRSIYCGYAAFLLWRIVSECLFDRSIHNIGSTRCKRLFFFLSDTVKK